MLYFIFIAGYVLLADAVAKYGELRKIGYSSAFLISVFMSPVIGYLLARSSDKLNKDSICATVRPEAANGSYSLEITRVTGIMLCINMLMFTFEIFAYRNGLISEVNALSLKTGGEFMPYQFISHLFVHGSVIHIYSNLCFLILCGASVERLIGEGRFLAVYLVGGIVGAALQTSLRMESGDSMVGASGCIYAIATLFAITDNSHFRNIKWLKMRYFVLPGIVYELTKILSPKDGVAHLAHIGGISVAVLFYLIFIWKRSR
jgi:membrane associated rhomboid family serine protease